MTSFRQTWTFGKCALACPNMSSPDIVSFLGGSLQGLHLFGGTVSPENSSWIWGLVLRLGLDSVP